MTLRIAALANSCFSNSSGHGPTQHCGTRSNADLLGHCYQHEDGDYLPVQSPERLDSGYLSPRSQSFALGMGYVDRTSKKPIFVSASKVPPPNLGALWVRFMCPGQSVWGTKPSSSLKPLSRASSSCLGEALSPGTSSSHGSSVGVTPEGRGRLAKHVLVGR